MDLRHLVSTDHANIRQIADQIRRAVGNDGPTGRDSLFDQFYDELSRHMTVMEKVVMPALHLDSGSAPSRDARDTHRDLMRRLDDLDSGDRSSAEWTSRFEAFTDELDRVFGEHMQMVSSFAAADSDRLARAYGRAKLKALRSSGRGWIVGVGAGLAAAALAAAVWSRTRRRRSGRDMAGDIGPTRRRLRVRAVVVQTAPVGTSATTIG